MAILLATERRILVRAYDQGYLGQGDFFAVKGRGLQCRYGPLRRAWDKLCETGSENVKRVTIKHPKNGYGAKKLRTLEEVACGERLPSNLEFPLIPARGEAKSARPDSDTEDEVLPLMESKLRAEMWKMRQAELDFKAAAGELVSAEATRRQANAAAQAVHNAFQPLADRYAASLAACRDEFEVHRIISTAIYEAMVQVDSEFKRLLRE